MANDVVEMHGPFRVIRHGTQGENWGDYTHALGVSAASVGARGLSLDIQTIPPSAQSPPHSHAGFEAALYILSGRIIHRFGPDLREEVENGPGDFIYVEPDQIHLSLNPSDTEPCVLVVARTTAEGAAGNLITTPES